MNSTPSDLHAAGQRIIADYLERLERAAADLPDGARAELLADIRGHLADTAGASPDEPTARRVLQELGEPEEIAAAAAPEPGTGPARPARTGADLAYDVGTVLVLLLGGFVVPVIGWIAGVVMLWNGPRWRLRHKWTGTLLWPAALVVGLAALLAAHAGGPAVVLLPVGAVVVVAGLVAGFAYLLRATRQAG